MRQLHTLDIAREKGVDVVTDNPLKTGEAGKTAEDIRGKTAVEIK